MTADVTTDLTSRIRAAVEAHRVLTENVKPGPWLASFEARHRDLATAEAWGVQP